MCGIVGYSGYRQASSVLLDGLEKLEYRGYDSAGICVQNKKSLSVVKSKGRLGALRDKIKRERPISGSSGIGHTRWATHGEPSDLNSHPHLSDSGKIALVHNGIIENEAIIREKLKSLGCRFCSETDTEVISNLIGYYYEEKPDFLAAVRKAVSKLKGSYALAIMCLDYPGRVVAVKKDSPLIFGFGERENLVASDVAAILQYTQTVVWLDDGELVVFDGRHAEFQNKEGDPITKTPETVSWMQSDMELCGYEHFMLKEIFEQPDALRDTIKAYLRDGKVCFEGIELDKAFFSNVQRIYCVACGSAYYVSVLAKYTIEKVCRIPTEAVMASEFRYSEPVLNKKNLVIIVSQSGETADSLAALREAKRLGAKTLAIVNVMGSSIAKAADATVYTWAGPEIAVATTKAFSCQLAVVYLLALYIAQELGTVSNEEYREISSALERLPRDVARILTVENLEICKGYADRYSGQRDAFYIGRNLDCAVCMEASLKLKEIAYLHSEAYPAGELKHGPISLIEKGTLVVALATVKPVFDKTLANVKEVKARGADVLCVTLEECLDAARKAADCVITVPSAHPMIQPSLSIIPLQLFSYYMAINRGCDVDKPRNLAKSVTVE